MVPWVEKYFETDKNDLYWEEKLISKMTDAHKYHLEKIWSNQSTKTNWVDGRVDSLIPKKK